MKLRKKHIVKEKGVKRQADEQKVTTLIIITNIINYCSRSSSNSIHQLPTSMDQFERETIKLYSFLIAPQQ